MCTHAHAHVFILCMDMCTGMCMDICMGMCMDMYRYGMSGRVDVDMDICVHICKE